MKKDIHPNNYRPVIFVDNASGVKFLIASTVPTKDTAKWTDHKEYPLFSVEISSQSHPFYTGKDQALDAAGRADKFNKKVAAAKTKKAVKAKK